METVKRHFYRAAIRLNVSRICKEAGFQEAADFFAAAAVYSVAQALSALADWRAAVK